MLQPEVVFANMRFDRPRQPSFQLCLLFGLPTIQNAANLCCWLCSEKSFVDRFVLFNQ
jgi:hypothetical protein